MMPLFEKFIKSLILEMPSRAKLFSVSHPEAQEIWNKQKDNVEFLSTEKFNNQEYDIYIQFFGEDIVKLYICPTESQVLVAYVAFDKIVNGIEINNIWTVSGSRLGIMEDLYIDFLVENFKFIRSDFIQTDRGFQLYKLFQKNPKVSFFIYDNIEEKEIPINQNDNINQYFGSDNKSRYQFVLRKNHIT
jgi:hypothetical protein